MADEGLAQLRAEITTTRDPEQIRRLGKTRTQG